MTVLIVIEFDNKNNIYLDLGVLNYLFNYKKQFTSLAPLSKPISFNLANGRRTQVIYSSKVTLKCNYPNSQKAKLILYNAILFRNTLLNLISTGQLKKASFVVNGRKDEIVVQKTGQIIAKFYQKINIAIISISKIPTLKEFLIFVIINLIVLVTLSTRDVIGGQCHFTRGAVSKNITLYNFIYIIVIIK